ncbi:unnamed protein product [Soboliphyme baturini]|uniref:DUF5615 domain-containing protein n=1 Tax=Soboliphyme baturini TaxID=241478 RepID=A0A183IY60_9BILA|nr:unnamed protein product [Soboliphyme baturini]
MLNFNQPLPDTVGVEPTWKVLVFDNFGQDILSPLFTVKELRERGVTLHLHLNGHREILSDVSCIYFIEANEENIRAVCQVVCKVEVFAALRCDVLVEYTHRVIVLYIAVSLPVQIEQHFGRSEILAIRICVILSFNKRRLFERMIT